MLDPLSMAPTDDFSSHIQEPYLPGSMVDKVTASSFQSVWQSGKDNGKHIETPWGIRTYICQVLCQTPQKFGKDGKYTRTVHCSWGGVRKCSWSLGSGGDWLL